MKIKRIISALSAAAMMLSALPLQVSAEGGNTKTKEGLTLPFELTAPEAVYASLTDTEGGNTVQLAWAKNDSMCEWATRDADPETHDALIEEFNDLGFSELWFQSQMDFSVDDTEHWQWSEDTDYYWLHDGYDEDYTPRLGDWAYLGLEGSNEKINEAWVFRWFGYIKDTSSPKSKDPLWYGTETYKGWKDVLPEGTYTVKKDSDKNQYAVFDWEGHKVYVRMRYYVIYSLLDDPDEIGRQTLASDWTEPVLLQTSFEPMTKEELTAPDIKDLKMCEDEEFNDYPVFSVMLNVPQELADAIARVASNYEYGGLTTLQIQARVKNNEEWVDLQGDIWINTGEMKFAMQNLYEAQQVPLNMPIQVRMRYVTSQSDDFGGEVTSDWSQLEFIKIILGDVNGDGKINVKDLTALQRWINGWPIEIVEEAADFNKDTKKNVKDLIAIQRYINSLPA